MKARNFFWIIPIYAKKIFRLFRVNKRSEIVWKELIRLHKKNNWHFGQYENEKYLLTSFGDENNNILNFYYELTREKLIFRVIVLNEFDTNCTNDIMVLSSHLNNLLNTGIVRIDVNNNFVEFVYTGDLLIYMLYPGEIHRDLEMHFRIAFDCYWAYSHLLNSGDEPVFVIAELIKRNNEKETNDN